jgi:hypothetical protein
MASDFQISRTKGAIRNPSAATLENGNHVAVWGLGTSRGIYYEPISIYGQLLSNNGSKIGSEFPIESNNNGYFPEVHPLQNNKFVVSYENHVSAANYTINIKIYDEKGTLVKECTPITFTVYWENINSNYYSHHSTASLVKNGFVVTWYDHHQEQGDGVLLGQRYHSNCDKDGEQFQVSEKHLPKFVVMDTITHDVDQFVTTWGSKSFPGLPVYPNPGIYSSWLDESNNPIKAIRVDHSLPHRIETVELSNGRIAMMWTTEKVEAGTASNRLVCKVYDPYLKPISQADVTLDDWNPPEYPYQISLSDTKDGRFVVAYQVFKNCDNCRSDIYGQYFNNDGAKEGVHFRINSENNKNQHSYPAISEFYLGKALVAWIESPNFFGDNEDVLMGNFITPHAALEVQVEASGQTGLYDDIVQAA